MIPEKNQTTYGIDYSIIKKAFPETQNFEESQFKIEKLSGLSNLIYKISANTINPFVYKHFLNQFLLMQSRELRKTIEQTIGELKFGPKIQQDDKIIQINEFLSQIPVDNDWLKKNLSKVASLIAKFHNIEIENITNIKTTFIAKIIENQMIHERINQLIKESKIAKTEQEQVLSIYNYLFSQELTAKCKEKINFLLKNDSIVLCHNDLNNTNFLFDKEANNLYILDCEFADWNFLGCELGNFFTEMSIAQNPSGNPFFRVEEKNFPNKDQRVALQLYYHYYQRVNKKAWPILTAKEDELQPQIIEDKLKAEFGGNAKYVQWIETLEKNMEIGCFFSNVLWLIVGGLSIGITELESNIVEQIKMRISNIKNFL